MRHYLLFMVCMSLLWSTSLSAQEVPSGEIWYSEPAEEWNDALPVGNGRMGAMVFGDPQRERIQLNEDSLWPGGPEWGNAKGTPEQLDQLRELILAGEVHLADSLIVEYFSYKEIGRSHQTMGDLYIDFHTTEIDSYRRSLNLDQAYVKTNFTADGYKVEQTVFTSRPDEVLVIHLKTENPAGLNLSLELNRPEDTGRKTVSITAKPEQLSMSGMVTQYSGARDSKPVVIDHGVQFETMLVPRWSGKGEASVEGDRLHLRGGREVVLLLVCATSFYEDDYAAVNRKRLESLQALSYEELLERHIADYRSLYDRVALDLDGPRLDSLSARERLARIKEGQSDIDLEEKLFNFGRYLLISCSRPGTNPANLQGLWNEHISAPWNADYHLNINLQMNYWLAEVINLSECHLPLFDLADRMIERGKILAREQYGMDGTIIHHTTDLWATPWMRAATPYWESWIHGGGWLVRHYWEHYEYTQDEVFLRERAYPALREFARFYLDWLIEDPEGTGLISVPETSPENAYYAADGHAVARGLFAHFASLAAGLDDGRCPRTMVDISWEEGRLSRLQLQSARDTELRTVIRNKLLATCLQQKR